MSKLIMFCCIGVCALIAASVLGAREIQTTDDPDDIYWDNSISMSIPGVDGEVNAAIVYDGKLIVGGHFTVAGSIAANNLAAWDGSSWSALGDGLCCGGGFVHVPTVSSLSLYDGKLIAGGSYSTAGGVVANYIASWDGSSWSPLGSGMESSDIYLSALTVYDGKLIAGFHAWPQGKNASVAVDAVVPSPLMSWDGSNWSQLPGVGYFVTALTVYDGKLIVGGGRRTPAGGFGSALAWDGANWSALDSAMDGPVTSLTTFDGKLIMGGYFDSAGSVSANGIASWDGSTWSPLGLGVGGVSALTVYDGKLIAGNQCWNGTSWSLMGSIMNETVSTLTVFDAKLIGGGWFTTADGATASGIASWDGTAWSALQPAYGEWVRALTVYENKLIVGGEFTAAGGVVADGIAAWDGSNWLQMDAGLGDGQHGIATTALAGFNGNLIAGGYFSAIAGEAGRLIRSWDGNNWNTMGTGIQASNWLYSIGVSVFETFNGKLIVGGGFDSAGGIAASNIAAWDGSNWSSLGSGIRGQWTSSPAVYALTVYQGKLIAAGSFAYAGERGAYNIAAWDGSTWSALGTPMDPGTYGEVYALAVYNGKLIAGGSFNRAGSTIVHDLACWDGINWSRLGGAWPSGHVYSLAVYDGKLIVGGDLYGGFPGVDAEGIVAWNGSEWRALGSGIPLGEGSGYDWVDAMTAYDGKLLVGGRFAHAGDKISTSLAAWTKHCCNGTVGNVDETGSVDLMDLSALVSYLTGGGYIPTCPSATNVNARGIVDLADLSALVNYLTGGGYLLPNCM